MAKRRASEVSGADDYTSSAVDSPDVSSVSSVRSSELLEEKEAGDGSYAITKRKITYSIARWTWIFYLLFYLAFILEEVVCFLKVYAKVNISIGFCSS